MKRLKKQIGLALILTMMVTVFAGCGNNPGGTPSTNAPASAPSTSAPANEPDAPSAMEPRVLTFASQSVGSGTYARVAAFCEVINKHLPEGWSVEISPISSGAQASAMLVENGTCDIGSGVNVTNQMLIDGAYEDVETLNNTLAVWGGTDFSYLSIFWSPEFQARTGFTTMEELIASGTSFSLATKAPGSSGIQAAQDLLACMGTSFEEVKTNGGQTYHVDPNQMCDMFKEGKVDMIIDCPSLGQAALTELLLTTKVYMPQLEEATLSAMEGYGYPRKDLPAGSWTGQENDMVTSVNCDSIVVRKDLPDDVVYAITQAICDYKDELVAIYPAFETFEAESAGDPLILGAPLHPGAERFYNEKGWLD